MRRSPRYGDLGVMYHAAVGRLTNCLYLFAGQARRQEQLIDMLIHNRLIAAHCGKRTSERGKGVDSVSKVDFKDPL